MKKVLLSTVIILAIGTLGAQTVTLTFTGRDAANHYVQLNRVSITNLTKSWQETIWWPDTVLQMQNGTGIDDHIANGGFALSQNNPNPFSGTTDVTLTVVEDGDMNLDIAEMNGRIVETQNFASLHPGAHQFRVSLSTVGTYVMTARQNGKTSSIKMICNGGGGSNTLDYLGMVQTITVVLKSSTNKPFNFGDQMEYVGYATINNTEAESQRITQTQGASQFFTLQFAETQIYYMPTVSTNTVSGITSNAATCGGNVTSDGGAAVTKRGVCWSTSHNPTISNDHTTNGNGMGAFTSSLTGLYAGRTYYVRAYARNSVGTSYGNEVSFTTSATLPEVTTGTVSNITATTAYCINNYVSNGGATITARGVCWSTSQNPTLNDSHTTQTDGTSSFTSSITGLAANTTYYVRAYATNSVGTAYGNAVSFTTLSPELPTVTTDNITNITLQTASVIGNVTNNGGTTLITRGVCWSTFHNPTIDNTHITNSGDTGSFTCSLSGLIANTMYYVRAYATNNVGTAYGNELTFITNIDGQPCPNNATVTDYDGNVYNTVQIGDQCWTRENMRTTHYANGASIPLGDATSPTMAYRYYPGNDANNVSTYGYLYNWCAAAGGATTIQNTYPLGVQGVCPNGWHLPSASEWHTMIFYVGTQSQYDCGYHNSGVYNIAKALASTTGWSSATGGCFPGDNPESNNATGFSALPACRYTGNNNTYNLGDGTYFWNASETQDASCCAKFCSIYNNNATVSEFQDSKHYGMSVRCVYGSITVNTSPISDVTGCTVTCGGSVTTEGINNVSRGLCWSESPHPSLSSFNNNSDYAEDSNSTDTFTITISGLTPNTTYYMRAFASALGGTTYGEEVSFTTNSMDAQSCPSSATVTDYDGNVYNTVQIGQQCWMKENVRSTHYSDGSGGGVEYTNPFNGSNDAPVSSYGYRYSWSATTKYLGSYLPSVVQGICPSGWHVPSSAEWTQLIDYVSSNSQYRCDFNSNSIAKALASKTGWEGWTSGTDCAVGNNPSTNNATGFSALPAGPIGGEAAFWSTSGPTLSNTAYRLTMSYSSPIVNTSDFPNTTPHSVRCLRNSCGCNLTLPNVTTIAVNTITYTTVSYSGDVTSSGGTTVSSRGVCWSTSQNPTIANNHTTDGSGAGVFNGILTGLTSGTTYYIRAYAINSVGTTYGNEVVFTTLDQASEGQPCPNAATVTDYDGNTYNTVKIGDQCWMKENLRTTHYANGVSIPTGSTQSYTAPYYYNYSYCNSNIPHSQCGYLYNWVAVMNGAVSSNANPSGVQGICPTGWHVPSDAEWTQLENYVSLLHPCNGNSSNIAKSLSSTNGWNNSYSNCTPGNSSSTNDATGFSGVPAGRYSNGGQGYDGESAYFWSSTEYNYRSIYSFYRRLKYNSESVYRDDIANNAGLSVRCIRD